MSVERIKEIIGKVEGKPLTEAITMSQDDIQALNAMNDTDRAKIYRSLGKGDINAQKASKGHDDFFGKADTADVDVQHKDVQIDGDRQFRQDFTQIENEQAVQDFFASLDDVLVSMGSAIFRQYDVRIHRGRDTIYVYLKTDGNNRYVTPKNEFTFIIKPTSQGVGKVEQIEMEWLSGKPAHLIHVMYTKLLQEARVRNICTINQRINTIYFK